MASIIKADTLQSTTANVFVLNSAGTEYARFDSGGNLGVGTTSPGVKLDVAGTTNIRHTYTGASGGILFGQYNTTGDAQIQNQSSGGIIALATNNTERMRIDASGNLGIGVTSPAFALNVKGSDYRVGLFESTSNLGPAVQIKGSKTYEFRSTNTGATEGAGLFFIYDKDNEASRLTINSGGVIAIKFAPTQVASADANTLDDYEEGTYTATITGSTTAGTQTYAGQAGRYTKVGNVVHVNVFVALNSATFTGAMKLSLPFTSVNDSSYGAGCIGYKNAWVTNGPNMFQVENNSSFGYVRRENAAGGTGVTDMAAANITTNTGFMVQVTYQVPS